MPGFWFLSLWKYIHIGRVQKEHGITDSFVCDIAPMSQAAVEGTRKGAAKGEEGGLFAYDCPVDHGKKWHF